MMMTKRAVLHGTLHDDATGITADVRLEVFIDTHVGIDTYSLHPVVTIVAPDLAPFTPDFGSYYKTGLIEKA